MVVAVDASGGRRSSTTRSRFWHLVIPSNPIVALFQLHVAGFGAVNGHLGFDKLEVTEDTALDSHAYAHYLHHKYFEVNYGGDGLIPLDRWFGTWHDGTREGDAADGRPLPEEEGTHERQGARRTIDHRRDAQRERSRAGEIEVHEFFLNPSDDGNREENEMKRINETS